MNFQEYYIIWEAKQRLDPKCWKGYRKQGTKMKGGKRVNNCVKEEVLHEELTPNHIHKLADRKGVKWDNEPSFLKLTKRLTGTEHLDDLDQSQLKRVKQHLENLNIKKKEILHEELISRFADLPPTAPHGFWVMKDGKIAVVSSMFGHDEVLQQLFPDIYGRLQGTKLLDAAMKNGIMRVAKAGSSYEGTYHPMYTSSTAKKTLKDIATHYQMGVIDDFAHYSHEPAALPVMAGL